MLEFLRKPKVYVVETKCIQCKRSGGIQTPVGWIRAKDESKAKVERYVQFGVCPKCSLESLGFNVVFLMRRCADCGILIEAEGTPPFDSAVEKQVRANMEEQISLGLCERCLAKRSGFSFARNDRELGLS
jgi:hypothetical protein